MIGGDRRMTEGMGVTGGESGSYGVTEYRISRSKGVNEHVS